MRALVACVVLAAAAPGCDASFTDLRARRAGGLGAADAGDLPGVDSGFDDAGNPASGERRLAEGRFENRAGHLGTGGAELVRLSNGAEVLRFGADFHVAGVPGPVVVLSSRAELGTRVDGATDVELGTLAMPRGAQSYPVPGGSNGKRVAWVFCKPFGVEVARAVLSEVP